MNKKTYFKTVLLIAFVVINISQGFSQEEKDLFIDTEVYKKLRVKPSLTNSEITNWDTAHAIYYNPKIENNRLLIWLAGTSGTPDRIPVALFNTALSQGYKIIALSYITVPAVAQVCKGDTLITNPGCTANFRRRRIYGDNGFSLIPDKPEDAIIPRTVKLLQFLVKADPRGKWGNYLSKNNSEPNWEGIALFGQSQGGGMAEFIGQNETIARVISFSGGWDYENSTSKKIAGWYYKKNATPMDRWYASYNANEATAAIIKEISTALRIPEKQILGFDKPLADGRKASGSANPYHGDGIRNIAYKSYWIEMLGSGL